MRCGQAHRHRRAQPLRGDSNPRAATRRRPGSVSRALPVGARTPRKSDRPSGDSDPTSDVPVALPIGPLAGEEWVVRRRLARSHGRRTPRGDRVFARPGRCPSRRPRTSRNSRVSVRAVAENQAASPVSRGRGRSGLLTARLAHPGGAENRVARASAARDFGRRRLEPIVAHRGKRPQRLAAALFLSDGDVAPGDEVTRVAVVHDLNARQPLDVGHTVPARRRRTGKPMLGGQRTPFIS